ncbi:MAG TPA: alanine racemase [Burkholderiaceae bacterium]|nr:alanine racemase [Burkholderiaceae bacterium]
MPRPIRATIAVSALQHNLAVARRHAGTRHVWAVIKANAYGHGVEVAVQAFQEADGLALLDLDEAHRARAAGWRKPILLLEGFFEAKDLAIVERLGLTAVVHHEEQVKMLEQHKGGGAQPIGVYLKLNSGMNRLGFDTPERARSARTRLEALGHVRIEALMTHLANADRIDPNQGPASVAEQVARFHELAAGWNGPTSLANSAALFFHPAVAGDAVRPGIVLYGAAPDPTHVAAALQLRPAMSLRSRLISTQSLGAGMSVGYGAQYVATRDVRIGVVACGYADGYPRHAPSGTPVAVLGVRVPSVGRVSMDMLCVDLSALPGAEVGAEVELWGDQIPIDEVAAAAGTVGYELMCALATRVPVQVEPA